MDDGELAEEPYEEPDEDMSRRPHDASDDRWAVDAALGTASMIAKAASAVRSSTPGRLAEDATKWLSQPLVERGQEVRDDAAPTAKRIISQVTPQVTEVVDINELLGLIDVNELLDHIDVDRLLGRIDLNALLAAADLDAVFDRV